MASASKLPSAAERLEPARQLCARADAHVTEAAREAKRLTLEGLYLLEAHAGTPVAARAEVLLKLGALRELLGELEAAETTYRRALALLGGAPGGEETDRLRSRAEARLAQVYCLQGRLDEADVVPGRSGMPTPAVVYGREAGAESAARRP